MKKTQVVIMAGGVGSRLYPLSTSERPKQFLDLLECGKTLIQLTYERFLAADPLAEFWIVTSSSYRHFIHEQLPAVADDHILCEPEPRNTAPAIAYACWKIKSLHSDSNVIVTPSDAFVPDHAAFAVTMRAALDFVSSCDGIVTVGIAPTEPHTGYGYIHSQGGDGVVKVLEFKEKPNLETATAYLAAGGYLWNAGIFVWNVRTIEKQLRTFAPQICGVMDELSAGFGTEGEEELLSRLFPTCEKISIDYAVMEKSPNVYTIAALWAWSDLGSFEAVNKIKTKI